MYTPIIGLEIHVELKTASKMFCGCPNDPFATAPNTNVCEVCLAHPGTLPVPNAKAIESTIKIAKALGCTIAPLSKFDRKHYFYPDLPKGYQISQYDQPIGEHGTIRLVLSSGKNHRNEATVGVTRVHLEEDTAKLVHGADGTTLVDFNRSGVPLVEIVSDPDIQSAEEAKMYCQELQLILRYLKVSDADMEKGQMRCEANISVQKTGTFTIENGIVKPEPGVQLNAKVEVKNINSFRAVERAIVHEIERQTALIERGETWSSQTRGWDDEKGVTVLQRSKETAADYRYFPEPDIPPFEPLTLVGGQVSIPELPSARRERFVEEFGFSASDAYLLTASAAWAEFTEQVMGEIYGWLEADVDESKEADKAVELRAVAKLTGGWITTKLMGAMAERAIDIRVLKVKPENFAELINLLYTNRVNATNALKILNEMLDAGVDLDPSHVMEEKGYGLVADEGALKPLVEQIINQFPKQVEQFKAGKEPIMKFLIGMVMKETEGSADPVVVEKMLRTLLKT